MPIGANSARSDSLKPCRANLLAQYSVEHGMPRWPRIEPTLTTIGRLPDAQQRQGQADHLGRGEEIDFHHLPQPLGRRLGETAHRADAGVVDQQVQPAEELAQPLDDRLAHLGRCDVAGKNFESARAPWRAGGQLLQAARRGGPPRAAARRSATRFVASARPMPLDRTGQNATTAEAIDRAMRHSIPGDVQIRLAAADVPFATLALRQFRAETECAAACPHVPLVSWASAAGACGRIVVSGPRHVAQRPLGNAAVDDHAAVGVVLREHFAVAGQVGQQPAVVDPRLHVDVEKAVAQGLADRGGQLIEPWPVWALIGIACG